MPFRLQLLSIITILGIVALVLFALTGCADRPCNMEQWGKGQCDR